MRILLSSFLLLFTLLPHITQSNIVIACRCSDGIIIGCDSLSVSGSYVGNRVAETVFLLGTNTVLCCATGHSDFHHLLSDLKSFIRTADVSSGGTIKTSSIARYARRLVTQKYRSAHLIIAGSDGTKNNRGRSKNDIDSSSGKKSTVITPNGDIPADSDETGKDLKQGSVEIISSEQDQLVSSIRIGTETEHETEHDQEYSVHEILSGGTLISQSYASAGSGSDCVITLMDELFTQSDSNSLSESLSRTQTKTQKQVDIFSITNNHKTKSTGKIHGNGNGNGNGEGNCEGRGGDSGSSLPTIKDSLGRMRKVLRASAQNDPKSGSSLRVWGLDRDGLTPL
jgi:20S proteasome alpha/beta subunit